MHTKSIVAATAFCSLFWGTCLFAQTNQTPAEKLESLLEQVNSPTAFEEIPVEDIAESKNRLQQAMAELERQLNQQGAQTAAAWKSYLDWDSLVEELESEKPSRSALQSIVHKLQMNYPGLELAVFTELRAAISNFANLSYFGGEGVAKRIYDSRLRLIGQSLKKLQAETDDRTIALIGEAVSDLENARQCPKLVAAVRKAFAKPNLHIQISEKLAKTIAREQRTADTRPLREEILGVLQRGTAHTVATFDVDFVPSVQSGVFKVRIDGNTISDQVGHKDLGLLGSVCICSQGNTCLVAEMTLDYDGKILSYYNLATGAKTQTRIKAVDTPPLLRNPTLKQIEKQKPQGERVAAERARTKFEGQLRTQLSEAIGKANFRLKNGVAKSVKRLDFKPKRFEVSTSDDFLRILGLVGNRTHLSGLTGPVSDSKSDVVIQIHESTLNNGLQHMLGGRSVSSSDLRKMILSFGIELPDPPKDEKEVTITFPRVRPVQVSFENGQIVTTISANRIEQDRTLVRDKLKIIVTYDLTSTAQTVSVARTKPVEITFDGVYTNAKSVIESNIKPKLEELFKKDIEQFDMNKLELPAEAKSVGLPNISKLELANGWVTAELNLADTKVAKQKVPVKKFSRVPVIPNTKQGVVIRPLITSQRSVASISDSSGFKAAPAVLMVDQTRDSDHLDRTGMGNRGLYRAHAITLAD